jgi:hypothetical protein
MTKPKSEPLYEGTEATPRQVGRTALSPPSPLTAVNLLRPTHLSAPQHLLLSLASPTSPTPLHAYIDSHAHVSRRGCFLFGNALSPTEDREGLITALAFPRLVALHTGHLDVSACEFTAEGDALLQGAAVAGGAVPGRGEEEEDGDEGASPRLDGPRSAAASAIALSSPSGPSGSGGGGKEADKEGAGRVVAYRASSSPLCFTLECHYNTGRHVTPIPPATNDGGRSTPPTAGTASARSGAGNTFA